LKHTMLEEQKSLHSPRGLGESTYWEEGGVKPPSPGNKLKRTAFSLTVKKTRVSLKKKKLLRIFL
jgi:hypothetical protein